MGMRRKIIAALLLHFLAAASIVLSRTYIDLLFLRTYPRDGLPSSFSLRPPRFYC